jgi:hypothetical protein
VELVRRNLSTPMVGAFALGVAAARAGSDPELPAAIYSGLSICPTSALAFLAERHFENHAPVAFVDDVPVVRGDKYV